MLNFLVLQGRLTDDPDVRYSKDNKPNATFSLAVRRDFVSKGGDDTDFIKVKAFGKTAELVRNYVTKGKMIIVTGNLKLDRYTDSEGKNRSSLSVYADKVYLVDSRREQPAAQPYDGGFVDVSAADDDAFELPF